MPFEINTNSTSDINTTDVTSTAELLGKYITKGGKEYIEFEKIELQSVFTKAKVYFTNLINGDEALTETLNAAVNENIDVIFEELSPIIGQTLGGIARQYFNRFFRLFSVDELFPRD
ncbi:hypothetical protein ILUMI_14042 [Ignelater luminosus]|uniref:Uncharacterized protein n=1 Tax=Ignelater luminosus TaxID=2038154 RepID=A0A8K0CR78_IGNLU|nr:hypothetical protein ILUMI_14042 [Ignelater luminosus]